MIDLNEIRRKTVSVEEYFSSMESPFKEKFLARKESYQLNQDAVIKLKRIADKYIVVVFSAEWCKDCVNNVPVLELVSRAVGLEVRVFGHIMKDALSTREKWRIPPAPPEVKTFGVEKLPWIIIFDKKGREVGKIIENPVHTGSIEEELLYISQNATDVSEIRSYESV